MKAQIEIIDGGKLPVIGSEGAAGWDLYARIPEGSVDILPGKHASIGLGVKIAPEKGWFGLLCIRSGVSKRGLMLSTGCSVIDEDYRGEIIACVCNHGNKPQIINDGDRLCQMVFLVRGFVEWEVTDTLPDTERGSGGFGSTGK